jgi:hypothetical protein
MHRHCLSRNRRNRYIQPCPQLPEESEPFFIEKTKIESDGVDRLTWQSQRCAHFGRSRCYRHRDALLLQIRSQKHLDKRFILHKEDRWTPLCHRQFSRPSSNRRPRLVALFKLSGKDRLIQPNEPRTIRRNRKSRELPVLDLQTQRFEAARSGRINI